MLLEHRLCIFLGTYKLKLGRKYEIFYRQVGRIRKNGAMMITCFVIRLNFLVLLRMHQYFSQGF